MKTFRGRHDSRVRSQRSDAPKPGSSYQRFCPDNAISAVQTPDAAQTQHDRSRSVPRSPPATPTEKTLSTRLMLTATGRFPGTGSLTGTTIDRRLRTGRGVVNATSKAVRAGDRLHNHARTRAKQKIKRFADRDLIMRQSVYSGDPQRSPLAGPPYP